MGQFDRIYQYKILFRKKSLLSKQEILAALEISDATFKRDLEKMRDFYNYDIVYDRFDNGYRLVNTDHTYELPGLMFSHKELLALLTIQNMMTELEPSLLGPKLQPLQDRLAELLASEGLSIQSLTQRIRAVHAGKRRLQMQSFQSVAQGTLERKKLHIHHYNRSRNETTERVISPQQLVHYRDIWYVDAWCHKREKLLSFSVDAITSCGGAIAADNTAPARMAIKAQALPSRRCIKSRSTSARPTISTPLGASIPGATGIRHGPFGTQKAPT